MSDYLSKKIRVLSLLCIVFVVYIHAYNLTDRYLLPYTLVQDPLSVSSFTEYFISNGLGRFAVPLFFAFSGYLFFLKFELTWKTYSEKLAKRIKSLLIPYLIWSGLGLLVVSVLQTTEVGSAIIDSWDHWYGTPPIPLLLYRWLWNPVPYQLWFVRDLMLYTLVSPLLYLLVKKGGRIPLVLLGLLWLAHFSFAIVETEGVLFFLIGAYYAIHKTRPPERFPGWVAPTLLLVWILLVTLKTFLAFRQEVLVAWCLIPIHKIAIMASVGGIWYGYDHRGEQWNENQALGNIAALTTFIYFGHEPLLNFINNYALAQGGIPLALYLTAPIATISLCVIAGVTLRGLVPPLYGLLTGGRGT